MRGQTENPILPLDHLALRGEDDADALVLRDRTLSYKDLRSRVGLLAGWLRGMVPERGGRVASWAAKGELTCLMPLAAARAGLVHVPVNPLLKHAQVAHILADSGAALLIGNAARLASLGEGDVPADCLVIEENAAWEAASAAGVALPPGDGGADELAAILYTSGSTGRPKGVMLSHANMVLGGRTAWRNILAWMPATGRWRCCRYRSIMGRISFFSTWHAGGCVVPLDYLLARDVVKAVARHGITTLAAVPPLWVQLAELEWPAETAAHLRRLTNSGGALTVDLVRRLRALFPQARLFPMYGLTEAFRSTYLDPALVDSHPTSMGKAIPPCRDPGHRRCRGGGG
ncbi:AMP-binding protein [Novosphingobium colocasiae]